MASSNEKTIGRIEFGVDYFTNGKEGPYVKDVYMDENTGEHSLALRASSKNEVESSWCACDTVYANKLNEITTGKWQVRKRIWIRFLEEGTSSIHCNKNNRLITGSSKENAILKQTINTKPVTAALHSEKKLWCI